MKNKEAFDHITKKLDNIRDITHNIDTRVTLMESHDKVQNEQLAYHIKRTDQLEDKFTSVDKDVSNLKFLKTHVYSAVVLVATVVTALHKFDIL